MIVTLREEHIATASDRGSVVVITGDGEDGQPVTFGADARVIEPVLMALVMDVEYEIEVDVEDWQVIRRG